VEGEIY